MSIIRNYPLTILSAVVMVLIAVPLSQAYQQTNAAQYACLANRGALTIVQCK